MYRESFRTRPGWRPQLLVAFSGALGAGVFISPYVAAILTGFQPGQSTATNRAWIFTWIVMGNYFGLMGLTARPTITLAVSLDSVGIAGG